ncbi:MAG: hypothetical protein ACR2OE_15550 [Thermomicrobiales bacterium]
MPATHRRVAIEVDPRTWLTTMFPGYVDRPFSAYHDEFWAWVWRIADGERIAPFVAVWPRGGGKSTATELACAATAARQVRRYGLYVSETQEQADVHVANVAGLLEGREFAATYPEASSRRVGKYGNSQGWRRNRLRTASGFTLDAVGLDTAARGLKMDEDRPDFLIFDDLDGKLDSARTTERKITTITHTLIPAGSATPAVLAVQNLVIPDGIFAQLADGRADFLADRIVSGPHPAIENLTYEQRDGRTVITGGTPTWEAMGSEVCQSDLDSMGLTAFLAEKQHNVEVPAGGMFDHLTFRHCTWAEVPPLVETTVWVDPAVTDTDQSDSHGMQADGKAVDGTIYRLYSWEARTSPDDSIRRAILKAVELRSRTVGVETDQGGDTWKSVYQQALDALITAGTITRAEAPRFTSAKAGAGHGPKAHRASQMLASYERGEIVHVVGTHELLERALKRFPKTKPFDLVDAAFWSWLHLANPVRRGLGTA